MAGIHSYVFNRKFKGKVWKMLPNSSGKYLAIEVRNEAKHQVCFFILNIENRIWLWQDVVFEEQWWINLKTFNSDQLQFVYYEDGSSPEQKQLLTIDIHTKEVIEGGDAEKEVVQVSKTIFPPLHYLETNPYFNTVSAFFRETLSLSPVKAVDYLETQGLIVISYYIWKSNDLANFLLIMDKNGSIKIHELLADQLTTIGIDTFFVIQSSLFTIRQKKELLIYDI